MDSLKLNWNPVAIKIQDMLKKRIISAGLIKTQHLIDSINVISNGDGSFPIEAEEYEKYLDDKYKISEVLNEDELGYFIENYLAIELEKRL